MNYIPRRAKFTLGILLALLPIVLWVALPVNLFDKIAAALRMDDRLVDAYAFMLGAVSELVAIHFLRHSRKRPWDWVSAFSLIGAILSGLAIFVFFGAASAVAMQGW
jgi:predicted permease